ncbi:arylesterase [Maritimibacter sp. DP1N21-5]|uniref:arylesterase n=1 Tax=Maritimibacter sp. DP1N21-5 TaxID=2836867 RepID=UPI001C45EF72|nr:arylesterase [Maritimibacter sp. DP1N21-5]MBV7410836.1 arylesterase [Maritimibacter sp. DP1N21-5]
MLPFLVLPSFADPVRILAFGDSLTQGYGLPQNQGLVPVLEGWLRARDAEVNVVNAGVSGDTTTGGLGRLDWSLTEDIDAVIVALGGNDLLRGTPPGTVEGNLDKILQKIGDRGLPVLLVGYKATPNYGPDYKTAFDALYPRLAERHDAIFFPYVFEGMAEAVATGTVTQEDLLQSDGIHPNATGVRLNVDAMGPSVLSLYEAARAMSD